MKYSKEYSNGITSFSGTDITVYIFIPGTYTKDKNKQLAFDGKTPFDDSFKYQKLGSLKLFSWSTMRHKSLVTSLGRGNGTGFTRGARVVTGMMAFLQLDRSAFYPLMNKELKSADSQSPFKYTSMPDELPPFDLLITYVNENLEASYRLVKHIEIVQSQGTDSIDDVDPVESYSFVALSITPLIPLNTEKYRKGIFFTPETSKRITGNVYSLGNITIGDILPINVVDLISPIVQDPTGLPVDLPTMGNPTDTGNSGSSGSSSENGDGLFIPETLQFTPVFPGDS